MDRIAKLTSMIHIRSTKQRTLYLWTLLLAMALLCAQGVKLHVHNLSHDHDQQHGPISGKGAVEHSHLSVAHLTIDSSHADHHEEVMSEIDASPDGFLKKVSNNLPTLALLATLFTLLLFHADRHTFHRRGDNDTVNAWRSHVFPPLRAPPL